MADRSSPCDELEAALVALDGATDAMNDVWHERPSALARLVERAEAADCDDLTQRFRWEAMLAYAYTSNAALLENDRPRFSGFHPDLLGDAALDYLVTRSSAPSVYVRSRVLDFLWEHGGTTRRRHGVGAGAAYLEVASLELSKVSLEDFGWLHVGDALVRAAKLARAANQRSVVRAVADKALELLERLRNEGTVRYVLDMAVALIGLCEILTADERRLVDVSLADTADDFAAVGDYHLSRAAMILRRRFAVASKSPDDVLRSLDVDVARSCLQEGDQREREGAHLVASIAYNQALELLERIGGEKELTGMARAALRRTRETGIGEMARISTGPIQLSAEHQAHIERVIATVTGASAPDCFRLLALHPALLVSRAEAEESERTLQSAAPLSHILPRVILRDGGQALAPRDPAEAARLRLYQTALNLIRIQDGLLLNTILERLVDRDDLGPDDLIRHLADSGHIPPKCMPIIEVGIRRLWARDWVSAIHILVPQLEEVMRALLRSAGQDTMRTHQGIAGVTVEVPLGYVLDQLATVILDDGVIFMLNLILDLYGANLRNMVGHGLVTIGDCSIDNVARIVQLYLILVGLRPAPATTPAADENSPETAPVGG